MFSRSKWLIGLLAATGLTGPVFADMLDDALLRQAPTLIERCRARGVAKVAVLPFRLRRAGEVVPPTRVLLCANLPTRIENALALKLRSAAPQLLVLRIPAADSSVTGESNERAARILQLACPPLWGEAASIRPDAVIDGEIEPAIDRRTMRVTVRGTDAQGQFDLLELDVPTDRNLLAELGQGFSWGTAAVRGITDAAVLEKVATDVAAVRVHPPATIGQPPTRNIVRERLVSQTSPEFPVELKLYYDNLPQELALDDAGLGSHNYLAPEPAPGQSLTFGVRSNYLKPVGVVLLVNGVSTLYEQEGEPSGMNKWVLDPATEYRIKGYHQQGNEKYRAVTVLTEQESRTRYDELGGVQFAGLIHLYVFRTVESQLEEPPMFVYSVGRLTRPDGVVPTFESLRDLQQAIARRSELYPPGTRPLAGWGKELQETLAERKLGRVALTDVMIVRYSLTKPLADSKSQD